MCNWKQKWFSLGRFTISLIIGLIVCILVSSFGAFAADCGGIRESVLRMHILANSDSAEDQALKLAVRDRILTLEESLLSETDSLDAAEATVFHQLEAIRTEAQEEVRRQGYDYPVEAEMVHMYFSTREYESFTLPAGWYDAVRITIGSGEGKNWWCVLYPPLCLPAAEAKPSDVLSSEQAEIVCNQEKYEYGFALVELLERFRNFFDGI